MRKIISLGLFALTISMFTSQVFAANEGVDACADLKNAGKGLHGLCVAWHNANDKHKDKFAAKFEDRAGFLLEDFLNPGSEPDFLCPCWTEISAEDVGKDAAAGFCLIDDTDPGFIGDVVTFTDGPIGPFQGFNVTNGACLYEDVIVQPDGSETGLMNQADLDVDEEVSCRMEIRDIAEQNFGQVEGDPVCIVLATPSP